MVDIKVTANQIMDGKLKYLLQNQLSLRQRKYDTIYIDFSYDELDIEKQIKLLINDELIDTNEYLETFLLDKENAIRKILKNKSMCYTVGSYFQGIEKFSTLIELCDNNCRVLNYFCTNDQFERLFNYCMIEKILQAIKSIA